MINNQKVFLTDINNHNVYKINGAARWHWIAMYALAYNWKIGAELGVKEGRFTSTLLRSCHDLKMIAVDLWEGQGNEHEDYIGWKHDEYYNNFKLNNQEYIDSDKLIIHKTTTNSASKSIDKDSLDFIFVDADHSYNAVRTDLNNWMPKVKKGGFIAGHDINLSSVRKAVLERIKSEFLLIGPNNCWGVWNNEYCLL